MKFGKNRLIIEVPKGLRDYITAGDTVIVYKQHYPLLKQDLKKLVKRLKGKYIEVAFDMGVETSEGYLKGLDSQGMLVISDKHGNPKVMFGSEVGQRIIHLKPKVVLKGYYINGEKVTEAQYKKAMVRKEFGIAQIVSEDSF